MHERYLRWVLGLDTVTPGYMVREECKREKMGVRAAKRAWGFESKLRSGKGNMWARLCLEEMDARVRVGVYQCKEGGECGEGKDKVFEEKRG